MERQQDQGRVGRIDQTEYTEVLPTLKHVFLVGDLKKPSIHPFIRENRFEFIVCDYQPGDDGRYHWHREVTEYELVLEGKIGYFEVATGETHWFETGDLSVIPLGICVRRLVPQRARTIAIKVPSRPEKVHCDQCDRSCVWRVKPYQG